MSALPQAVRGVLYVGAPAMSSQTTKQKIIQAVECLPKNATFDDAIEQLCFLAKVKEGMRESNTGGTVPHRDATRQILG